MLNLRIPKEQKDELVERIQEYFACERGEELGHLAAEQIMDFMLRLLGPTLYNQAIADARSVLSERMAALEDELFALEKPLPRVKRS